MRTTAIRVFHKVGHVLLQKRDNIPTIQEPGRGDVWGGHCTAGEMPAACAIRELREEIGVEIVDPQALKILMTRSVDGREEFVFAYVFDADGTPPVHEGERAEWFAPEAAASMAMASLRGLAFRILTDHLFAIYQTEQLCRLMGRHLADRSLPA
jgi:8-oxo-dGTP pyrophosphatase MutT (NUDIX family)